MAASLVADDASVAPVGDGRLARLGLMAESLSVLWCVDSGQAQFKGEMTSIAYGEGVAFGDADYNPIELLRADG